MSTDEGRDKQVHAEGTRDKYPELPPTMKRFSMILFFLIGAGVGAFLFGNPFDIPFLPGGGEKEEKAAQAPSTHTEKERELWTCPMHPHVLEEEPGDCPICMMKLVQVSQEKEDGTIRIDPMTVQNIGIRSDPVVRGTLTHPIRTMGIVDYNEKNVSLVTTKFEGWIEKVYINYVGERVKKGQPLFEIYSPELVSTQEEYLTAFDYHQSLMEGARADVIQKAEALLEATRERLRYWDITTGQIRELERNRTAKRTLTVVSSVRGLVVNKMDTALDGMFVKPGMNLYRIADLSSVWIHADVFEYEVPWIREGQDAEVELAYFPGETLHGKVLFVQPFLKEKTRTIKVCIELNNPEKKLRPQMYANVKLLPVISKEALLVPEDAVLRSGERNVVFIDLGQGQFRPQEVNLGVQGERVFEIKSGLKEGDRVVVSAQFLLDSESKLQETIRKMLSPEQEKKPSAPAEKMGKMISKSSEETLLLAIREYTMIGDMLAQDTVEGINESITRLKGTLDTLLKNEEPDSFLSLVTAAGKISEDMKGEKLSEVREQYKELSQAVIDLLQGVTFRARDEHLTLYVEYCSMAEAHWVQNIPEIHNPYFGSSMLRCGEQKEEIHIGMQHN